MPARARQLAALYRVLARLASAGIPPIQQAAMLEASPQGPLAREAASAIARALATGTSAGAALRDVRGVPRMHAAVIGAGETTGRLDTAFDQLATSCEEEARVQATALRMLLQPAAAWLVIALVLPIGTLIRSGLGAYLGWALPILAAPLLLAVVLKRSAARHAQLPGFTESLRLLATARFARTLGLLNAAGLPLPRSLRDAGEAAAHPEVTPAAARAALAIERGATLGEALRRAGVLRPVEMSLVADGEATGRIDVAFLRAAALLEHEGFEKARSRLRVVGAALFVILAVFVAVQLHGAIVPELRGLDG